MAEVGKFEPGTIVRFKNLTKRAEMNNSYGIVKNKLDNGNLRIRVNSKNDMAVQEKFCEPVIQCLNKDVGRVPCMIWTRSTGETIPRAHWLYEAPKNIFPKEAFDKMQFNCLPEFIEWEKMPGKLVGEENAKKTVAYLKDTLNWKAPKIKAFLRPQIIIMFWHDSESTAKPNHVLNTMINSVNNCRQMKPQNDGIVNIRGPVMYFEECKMLDPEIGTVRINSLMAIMITSAENFKHRMNLTETELTQKVRSGEIYIDWPFEAECTSRMCDLEIKQATDSVCKKMKGKQKCKDCVKVVKRVTAPAWKRNRCKFSAAQLNIAKKQSQK